MKKILSLIILLFTVGTAAQDKAQTDRWRGLIVDETTPAQAIEILGKPKRDKTDQQHRPLKFNEWFDVKEKNFRILHYEKLEGFEDIKLIFRADKLVAIWLEPKKLEANALSRAYGVEFVYLSDKFAQSANPGDFERNEGKVYPKSYPTVYFLMNNNPKTYVFTMIANNSFGSILSKSAGVQDSSESLPGKVSIIEIISKKLESNAGADLLK